MRNVMLLLTFVYLICSASSCLNMRPPEFPLLTFVNNSDEGLELDINDDYPDTLAKRIWMDYVEANKKKEIVYYANGNKLFKKIPFLQIMVYGRSAENQPIDTVRKYNLVLKRYQLSKHDLDSMNWVVTYP